MRLTLEGVLTTLASKAEQLEYQAEVPCVDVVGEMNCQWFDDVYHPADPQWCAAFSMEERDALGAFSEVLRKHSEKVKRRRLLDVLLLPEWAEVVAAAKTCLATIRKHSSKVTDRDER